MQYFDINGSITGLGVFCDLSKTSNDVFNLYIIIIVFVDIQTLLYKKLDFMRHKEVYMKTRLKSVIKCEISS